MSSPSFSASYLLNPRALFIAPGHSHSATLTPPSADTTTVHIPPVISIVSAHMFSPTCLHLSRVFVCFILSLALFPPCFSSHVHETLRFLLIQPRVNRIWERCKYAWFQEVFTQSGWIPARVNINPTALYIIKIPILMPVQNAFFCTGIPTFSYASTKWKKNILANSVKKKYTGKQCVFLYWHEDQIYNILARLSVLAHPSKKFICQYKMENNILATNVFLYWRRTNSQTYW